MANAFTDTSALSGLVQTAYDRYVEFALRSQPMIRSVADKRPAQQAMPGSSVVFSLYNDMSAASSALTETTDPDAVAIGAVSTVTVTLAEYGNAALATRKLQLFSLSDVDPAIADMLAFNMADSMDKVAMAKLITGTNVIYGGAITSTATIAAASTLTGANIRKAVSRLRKNKAVPREGSLYWCGIHPEVSHDLRSESGSIGWRDMHAYSGEANANVWAGTIGTYEGAFFVETPRMYNAKDGADQTALATASAVSGVSAAFTIVAANAAFGGKAEVGDKISGTNVGTAAKITAISVGATNTTFTVDVANSGTVGTNTLTVTPVTRNYRSIIAGKQALAEAVAQEPSVVIGPVTDKLMRFRPIGWYGVLGFSLYRDEALYRLEHGSSIGAL